LKGLSSVNVFALYSSDFACQRNKREPRGWCVNVSSILVSIIEYTCIIIIYPFIYNIIV